MRFNVTATDPNDLPVQVGATIPPGAQFDPATGAFTWRLTATDLGRHEATFTAGTNLRKTVGVYVGTGEPVLESLQNGASAQAAAVCSPKSVATLTGHALYAGGADASDYSGLSTQLNGTRVIVNGIAAPVLYGSAEKVSFLCPASSAGANLQIAVQTPAGTSNVLESQMAAAAPGIFTVENAESMQAVALASGSGELSQLPTYRQPGLPVLSEGALTVRATGVSCDPATTAQTSVKVGGQEALIQSMRMSQYAGVCEIAIQVPNVSGDALPMVLAVAGSEGHITLSNVAMIAVGSR